MMSRFSRLIARLVVHRPKTLVAIAVLAVLACVAIVKLRQNFDSEVLNLLPQNVASVRALKALNNEFVQAHELMFALHGEPDVVADFEEPFIESLRAEPWVVRIFTGSPMETPEGMAALQDLIPALLLNLDPPAFQEAMKLLSTGATGERVRRLRAEIEAGSAKAEMQLSTDPLGLLASAMKPMSRLGAMEKGQSLTSRDGRVRVIPVVTNQASLSQPECQALMQRVDAFIDRVRKAHPDRTPEVLVTGRSAYVAQISASMRRDVQVTSMVSIIMVAGLFYFGFRRLLPLAGIITTLGLSCFVSFAIGSLLFANLNMIAIAFCSILVGLGDDFSLMLYNRYLQARRAREDHETAIATSIADVGSSILYVSLTTGVGFLVLLFSGSAGFAQLGVLIAIGIVLCGVSMIVLLFLFIRPQMPDPRPDLFGTLVARYAAWTLQNPRKLVGPVLALFAITVSFAIWPAKPLTFDTSPRSMEPKDSKAAIALKLITDNLPAATEPVVVLVESSSVQNAHDQWTRLSGHFDELVRRGDLASYSGPAPLLISPANVQQNQVRLQTVQIDVARNSFVQALEQAGFNPEGFTEAIALFAKLKLAATASVETLDLRQTLPAASSWWFLIDRYFSSRPFVAAAYLKPVHPLTNAEDQDTLEQKIREGGVPVRVTGWSYAMVSLVPWAKRELVIFSLGVGAIVGLLLGIAYRDWRPWLIHVASLAFAIAGTVGTLKLAGLKINMLNALAFPLILGVGVDYGLHVLFAARAIEQRKENLITVLKPLVICGLTTTTGFGSLILARNPALSGLGLVCALGVGWCLMSALFFVLPLISLRRASDSPR